MKKLMYLVLVILLVSLLFLVYNTKASKNIAKEQYISQNKINENVMVAEIDISKNKNLEFLTDINDVKKVNGVYGYNNGVYGLSSDKENKILVLFNGIDGYYSDINFSIENNVLSINYRYTAEKGFNKKSLFMIDDSDKNRSYDTIDLHKNGEQDFYENITA